MRCCLPKGRAWMVCLSLALGAGIFPACSCDETPAEDLLDAHSNADDAGVEPRDYGFDELGRAVDAPAQAPDYGFDGLGRPIDAGTQGPADFGFDELGRPIDGGISNATDAASTDGSPLDQPLSEFCKGTGTVVIIGEGNQCAGTVAENTFRFALCTCESAEVQSNLSLDAFDSTRGTYGSTLSGGGINRISDGQFGSNGPLVMDGKLTVEGSAFVAGNLFSVGSQSAVALNLFSGGGATQNNSSTNVGRNAFINGNVIGRYVITGNLTVPAGATIDQATLNSVGGSVVRAPVNVRPPCACGANEILNIAAITEFGRTHNDNAVRRVITATTWANGTGPNVIELPCGRYYLSRIHHPRTLTIRALDRTVLFVDGDFAVEGGMSFEIAPGAEIDLFVKNDLSVQAAARFGDPSAPSKVRTYVGGTSTVAMNASSSFGGNLYAPRAHVEFGASADLYGSLFARSVSFSGSASVHYDTAVRRASQSCNPPPADGGVRDGGMGADATGASDATAAGDQGPPVDANPAADAQTGTDRANPDGAPSDTGARDAGSTDSGPASCSGCFSCGSLACINNMCLPCQSDLDCCAPYICAAGQCVLGI